MPHPRLPQSPPLDCDPVCVLGSQYAQALHSVVSNLGTKDIHSLVFDKHTRKDFLATRFYAVAAHERQQTSWTNIFPQPKSLTFFIPSFKLRPLAPAHLRPSPSSAVEKPISTSRRVSTMSTHLYSPSTTGNPQSVSSTFTWSSRVQLCTCWRTEISRIWIWIWNFGCFLHPSHYRILRCLRSQVISSTSIFQKLRETVADDSDTMTRARLLSPAPRLHMDTLVKFYPSSKELARLCDLTPP
ncbi:hypothetical protein D9619_009815 [Psilocybe cf. subviscida]|uniref:Uncharacterized protein n=1 Tax=Psilocybe cf. subviscida TaxID=2480587 RepID=A0A8H5BKD5_9AGAR|nr:hypothetical protein D9619_009815 [Psilocybe cf. subviscida]